MGAMKSGYRQPLLLGWACLVFLLSSMRADAQKCQRSFIINSKNVTLKHCKHVGDADATLSWKYNAEEWSILLVYKAKPKTTQGWIAWGINPSSQGLVGTQALLAMRQPGGTMSMGIYNGVSKAGTPQAAEFIKADNSEVQFQSYLSVFQFGSIYIYANVLLPSNRTTVNQAWQRGSPVVGGLDAFPITDLGSFGTIDLLKGNIPPTSSPTSPPAPSPSNPPPLSPPYVPSPPAPSPSNPPPPSPSPSIPNPPSSPPTPTPSITPPSPLPSPSSSPSPSSPSPSTQNPPSSSPTPTPTPSTTPPSPSPSPPSPSTPIGPPPSPTPSMTPPPSPSPSPSPSSPSLLTPTPTISIPPFSPSPSPLPSLPSNNANAHATISIISFSFISLFTAFACTMFSTM